jgi:WD40 repeat protein
LGPTVADVFISYSRPDGEFVHRLHDALEAAGKDVWVDFEDIAPASPWARVVTEAIGACDAFVFVLSPDSVGSAQCQVELERAVSLKKRIVPLHLRATDPKSMPDPLSAHNWVPQIGLFDDDFDAAFRRLITAIETDLEWVREHTHWGQKAAEWEESGHDNSFLLSGAELRAAEAWLARQAGKEPAPTDAQTRLVLESRRRATNRLRLMGALVSAALVVAVGLLVLALIQRQAAIDSKKTAQSRELAAKAEANLASDPTHSVQEALQALDTRYTDQAEASLRDALPRLQLLRIVHAGAPLFGAAWDHKGNRFVTAGTHRAVELWDARTATMTKTWRIHHSLQGSVALSPNGREVAVTTGGRKAALLFVGGHHRIPLKEAQPMSDVAFSASGDEVVTASQDGTATIRSAATGKKLERLGHPDPGALTAAAFGGHDREVVTGGQDGQVRVWDVATGKELRAIGRPQTSPIGDVAFSHDGKLIATAGIDFAARIWHAAGGRPLVLNGHVGAVHTVSFSPNDAKVVTSSADGSARIWDVSTGALLNTLSGHRAPVLAAAFDPDASGKLLTASYDGTARIWWAASREARKTLPAAGAVNSAELSRNGEELALATKHGKVKIWHFKPRQHTLIDVGETAVNTASFNRDGTKIVTASQDHKATIWSAATRRPLRHLRGDRSPVKDAVFSPDGKKVVIATYDGRAIVFDAESGHRIYRFHGPHQVMNSASFSPDGNEVVTASQDGVARIWRIGKSTPIEMLPAPGGPMQDAAFSPDGKEVVTAGADRRVRIWNLSSTRDPIATLARHTGPVYTAAFSGDGQKVLSASADGTARIWSVASGTQLTAVGAPGVRLNGASWSRDGKLIVTANENDTATIWSTELAAPLDRIEAIARSRLAQIHKRSRDGT